MNTTIGDLAQILEDNNLLVAWIGDKMADEGVNGCACDSRCVKPGDIFICKGLNFKEEFLDSALEKGASSYLCDEQLSSILSAKHPNVPCLVVNDLRLAMAIVSPVAFGNPDRDLFCIGITGTKGKSTMSYMLKHIIDVAQPEHDASLIGSIQTYDGIEKFTSHNTTPEPPDLQRHLANALASGHSPLIMEVSSQGLKYDRVRDLDLDLACFLNIDTDHISPQEHSDFEDYFTSKLMIFDLCKKAVINLDSKHANRILDTAHTSTKCQDVLTVSAQSSEADYWAENATSSEGKISFVCHTPNWTDKIEIPMLGLFNIENALCAIALADQYGCSKEVIQEGLSTTKVPGRMEFYPTQDPKIKAIVDFAHNRLSYQKFFESLSKEFDGYNVISIFGVPGGKATDRRFELPQVAQNYSNHIILCEDDPIMDDVNQICVEMSQNITNGCSHEIIIDRTDACRQAIKLAQQSNKPTVICMLGKGEVNWMHRKERFDVEITDGERFMLAANELIDC